MKTLVDYIKESQEKEEVPASKSFKFNFNGCEGTEDFLKSIQDIADNNDLSVTVEDEKLSFTVSKDDIEKYDKLLEVLQDFIHLRGRDSKRASDEQYAQKLHKLESKLAELSSYLEDAETEEAPEDDNKKDDKKDNEKDSKKEEE